MDSLRLGIDPFVPLTVLYVLAGLALLVWIVYLIRRGRAWLTRGLGLTLILAALANPAVVEEEREPLKSIAAIVVDRSESMSFGSRTATAEATFQQVRSTLEADPTLDVRIVETNPKANGTEIRRALEEAFADAPRDRIAGSIVITDGQVHDLPLNPETMAPLGPIHALIAGDPAEGDRRIEIKQAPNFGIVGERAEITVEVTEPAAPLVTLTVSVDGNDPFTVVAESNAETVISIPIERRGPNTVVIEAPEGNRELTLANNRTAQTISGVHDHLRVLLITGEPHQGARVWRDLLKSDPDVDLVHFTILRPPHKQDGTPTNELALIAFPTRELFEEKLDEFDLIIFDQYHRRGVLQLGYFDNMARYVDRGGALMIVTGTQFAGPASLHRTPLAAVLPVRPTGAVIERPFLPSMTERGERHTVSAPLTDQSWGRWQRYVGSEKITGDTLLETDDGSPLLVLDRVGDGRVAELMSDHLWLWARGHDGGGPFAEIVRRLVHWLMKEPELEEERLSMTISGGKAIAQLRTLEETAPPLGLEDPEGTVEALEWQQVSPGLFEAETDVERLGMYRATAGELETVALNGPANPLEYTDLRSTTEVMRYVADESGGSVRRIGSADDLNLPDIRRVSNRGRAAGSQWIGLRDRDAYAVRSSQSRPLLPGVSAMIMLLILLVYAWRREGR